MPIVAKQNSKDEAKIGVHAPKQPLSGIAIVTSTVVKGFSNISFVRTEETKKSV